jgi:hypothetical protein
LLPRLQADELLGIDLPDVVRLAGAADVGRGAATLGGRAQAGRAEPALERALGRQRHRRSRATQENADEASPPGRVLAAQGHGLVVQLLGGVGAGAAAAAVGRG